MFDPQRIRDHVRDTTGRDLTYHSPPWRVLKEFGDLVKSEPALAPALIGPIPDKTTGATAFNSKDLDYLVGGLFQSNVVCREMFKVLDASAPLDILDFGCGAGRLLRYFLLFAPEHRYHACEVNAASLDFVHDLPGAVDTRQIGPQPSSPFADASMDAVYAWSIWTHYDEPTGRAWLEDLHRILRPGGCALITVHSDELVRRYGREPALVKKMQERGGNYREIMREYTARGFSFWRAYPESASEFGIDANTFGMAFISRPYIEKNWLDLFDLKTIVNGDPGWQDLVVLQKK